ncbi:hypothetical protein K443DRAFT_323167 [Laccaria amethystina LaAM-08-1]|uniref:Uncharacterized protein n=1 Tax=Laccaria amethystina LaAM-08-1 TaxID=1095629 RepID=A0A0C9XD27_9AGAR|nr:hypothetical protein K443DRAFT_323167 [Laccaria amethystina LaAM-08-1]
MLSNPSLRSYLLRSVVACSIISIPAITVAYLNGLPHITFAWLLVPCEVMIHHMTTVIAWRYFPELFDLILVSLEISAWFYLGLSKLVVGRWSTVILAVTLYALVAGLCLTWAFRVACILRSRGRKLLEPFDLFSGCESPPPQSSRHQVLFGIVIWKSAFKGETIIMRGLRGVLAISLLFAVFVFPAISIIIEPIWCLVAFIGMRLPIASQPDVFNTAISVTPLWDNS